MDTIKFNHSDATNQADAISLLLAKSDDAQAEAMDLIRGRGSVAFHQRQYTSWRIYGATH